MENKTMDNLEQYIANRFEGCTENTFQNTDFLDTWKSYVRFANLFGAAAMINKKLCPSRPVCFQLPDKLKVEIFSSFAGEIPIIYIYDTEDFESTVTNIVHKGIKPDNISKTGASFVFGKTTRFIILSAKPYSNVTAEELGLDEADWLEKSVFLRRGHECTHYFTKQVYGVSNNIVHDEIMADFIGMYEAFGYYKADWFLKFMGILPGNGKRLDVYIKDLNPENQDDIISLVKTASYALEKWSQTSAFAEMTTAERIQFMCKKGLKGLCEL